MGSSIRGLDERLQLLDRAHLALEAGDFSSAQTTASALVAAHSGDAAVEHLAGLIALEGSRVESAISHFVKAVRAAPGVHVYWTHLGAAYGRGQRFAESAQCFRQALLLDSQDADTYYNLAAAVRGLGDLRGAIELLKTALRFRPTFTEALFNLANACRDLGLTEEAIGFYRQAVDIRPNYGKALVNLGNLLARTGSTEESVGVLERAAQAQSGTGKSLRSLTAAYHTAGRIHESLDAARKAVERAPHDVEAHHALGAVFEDQGMIHEALDAYRAALRLSPEHVFVLLKLGRCLMSMGRLEAATECFEKVVELRPETAAAYNNIGVARLSQGRWEEAEHALQKAADIDPNMADARANLGTAFHEQGLFQAALQEYDAALAISPDLPDARWNRSLLLLRHDSEPEGWAEYESRWQRAEHVASQFRHPPGSVAAPRRYGRLPPRCAEAPLWTGEQLRGEAVLIFAEQGLGDTIQFARFLADAKHQGARTILECQRPLVPILKSCPFADLVVGQGDELPPVDLQVPLLSLPNTLRTSTTTMHVEPYLSAERALCEQWSSILSSIKGFRVGVAWQGNPAFAADQHRSAPLAQFAPLAKVQGVRLVSLQRKIGLDQVANVSQWFEVVDLGTDVDTNSGAFMDTAAILKTLDLVVTTDSALPHLAGALGVETWLALPKTPDWRWGIAGESTPWYPTMRLFRQTTSGDWSGVFKRIAAELQRRITSKERPF